jgi:hypothetical protein
VPEVRSAGFCCCCCCCCCGGGGAEGSYLVRDRLCGPLKQNMGGRQFHSIEKVTWLVTNRSECTGPVCTAMEYFNSYQDGINASVCSVVIVRINDSSLE